MEKKKEHTQDFLKEGESILASIHQIQQQLICARQGFESATDEVLIDSYIFEIIALHKKYEFFLKEAKEMGISAPYSKIS